MSSFLLRCLCIFIFLKLHMNYICKGSACYVNPIIKPTAQLKPPGLTDTNSQTQSHICTYMYSYIHTHTYTHHTHTMHHTHTQTHTHTHTHMRAHTHTHIHSMHTHHAPHTHTYTQTHVHALLHLFTKCCISLRIKPGKSSLVNLKQKGLLLRFEESFFMK